jgi:hypothetical protein
LTAQQAAYGECETGERTMTKKELEDRVAELEKTVTELKAQLAQANGKPEGWEWWREGAGRFANDPVFDEIVRLGKEWRDKQLPEYMKKKKKKKSTKMKSEKN